MRRGLVDDLRAVGHPLCLEAAATLEGIQARQEAGAALKAMLDGIDTPLGKKQLANAFRFAVVNSGSYHIAGRDAQEVVNAIGNMLQNMVFSIGANLESSL